MRCVCRAPSRLDTAASAFHVLLALFPCVVASPPMWGSLVAVASRQAASLAGGGGGSGSGGGGGGVAAAAHRGDAPAFGAYS